MPFFHATTSDRLPSIRQHGIGGIETGPRSEECARGVYLATDPRLAVTVALMHAMNTRGDGRTPAEAVAAISVILVDDSRVDRELLRPDPQVQGWDGSWLYDGVIDVTSAPILTIAQIDEGWAGVDPTQWGWVERSPESER